jgi:hypothetical protein
MGGVVEDQFELMDSTSKSQHKTITGREFKQRRFRFRNSSDNMAELAKRKKKRFNVGTKPVAGQIQQHAVWRLPEQLA